MKKRVPIMDLTNKDLRKKGINPEEVSDQDFRKIADHTQVLMNKGEEFKFALEQAVAWIDRHSVTCSYCGCYADERETVRLEEDGCRELENALDVSYGDVAEFHKECFEELTKRLPIEAQTLIMNADLGMTPADIMPLQDEVSNV